MRTIFLDDDHDRIREFQKICPEIQHIETTAEGLLTILRTRTEPIDTLFLDHDLGGKVFVDSKRPDCGMEIVRYLVAHQMDIRLIVVHTHNFRAAKRMSFDLMEAGYRVHRQEFGTPAFNAIASINTADDHLEMVRIADTNRVLTVEDQQAMFREVNEELRGELSRLGFCPTCRQEISHDINEPFASCGCAATMEWAGTLPVLAELREKIRRLTAENDTLRGIVARSPEKCVHCGLEDMSKCASGFPGCARADDILCADDAEMCSLRDRLRAAEESARHNQTKQDG